MDQETLKNKIKSAEERNDVFLLNYYKEKLEGLTGKDQ